MGQGQDKIARSFLDLQPTAIIELFLLYFNTADDENVFIAFHGGSIFSKSIKWQGIDYIPIPVESEGFEVNANGQMSRPKIRISNKDYFATDLLLNNDDLQFAKIIRKRTFVKYLDDSNFDGGNPWLAADATAEISNDTYVVGQKTAENKNFIELELTSPLDLENFEVNNRLILSRYCSWYYRGNGCNYQGPPIQTEDGRDIKMSGNGSDWYKTTSWKTGVQFSSGQATYIENKKIIISDPQDSSKKDYSKIWYVCQQPHTSSKEIKPDSNSTYWLRDGCNKKLDGCKKRFQSFSKAVFNTQEVAITNSYIDFSHKSNLNAYNNIAPLSTIAASTQLDDYEAFNAIDMQTGSPDYGFSWASNETKPWINLEWDSAKTINRIDIYDRPDLSNYFSGAYISFYNGVSLIKSGVLTNIPNNGSKISSGFSPIAITSLKISGSGSSGANVGLGEICVFEPTGLGLYNTNFKSDKVYQSDYWQLSSWIQFPNGTSRPDQYTNVLHNVKQNCQYSGINLYVQGNGSDQRLVLDFATRIASGNPITYITKNQSLSIPWQADTLQPFHIICSGGNATGASPSLFKEGFIVLSGNGKSDNLNILSRKPAKNLSGEFFLFKNNSYDSSTDNLKFAINDWQFSDIQFTPNLNNKRPEANTKITSNLLLGATAIWTGSSYQEARTSFFNRKDNDSNKTNAQAAGLKPRRFDELTDNNYKSNLYAWWDMDITGSSAYSTAASNNSSKIIYLSGQYQSSIDYSETTTYLTASENPQSIDKYLPFGGFPGTDRYGR